ncbi:MAG TPA: TonB-dependent receptor [Bacteroidales bacterium]|nr:TonB-dependent receptor [Bacteroidales bacterium]
MMKMTLYVKKGLLLLWILLAAVFASAQDATVYGKVLDAKTGTPLIGAVITFSPVAAETSTNSKGVYEAGKLAAGQCRITASHVNYDIREFLLTLEPGERRQVDFYLDPAPNMLKMVIVKEKYIREIPYIQHTLVKSDIEMMPVRDIGDQLRLLPNVSGIKKGAVNIDPVVRGFKFSQLTILMDGAITIEGGCPNRMDPTTSHIALDDMSEMQVLKGPFALRYGAVFGGVVNLVPVKPVASDVFEIKVKGVKAFESNWMGNREYVNVAGGSQRYYFLVSAYNQKYGDYSDGNGVRYQTDHHKFGYKGALGIRPFRGHELMVSWSQSMSKGIMFPALPMDDRSDDSRVLSVDYKVGKLNDLVNSLDLKVYTASVDHVMDNKQKPFSDTTAATATILADVQGGRFEAGLNLGGGHLYVGADQKTIQKTGDRVKVMIMQNPMNGKVPVKTEQLWNNAEINDLGFFAEYKKRVKRLDLIAAARFDINDATSDSIRLYGMGTPPPVLIKIDTTDSHFTAFSFSAGVTYNFSEKLNLSLAAGRGTRFPNMLERFIVSLPVGFDNFEYMGNPSLKPEINNEADLNLRFTHPVFGGADLTLFYSFVQDYISGQRIPVSQQKPLTDNVLGVKRFENFETAVFSGFEFSLKTPEKYNLAGAVTASYTQGIIKNVTKPLLDSTKPPLQSVIGDTMLAEDPASEIPPFEMNLMVRYRLFGGKVVPSATWRVVAAQEKVSKAYFEQTTPGFNIIGLHVAYRHNAYLTVSGGVTNLLNTAYYEHLSRRIIGSTLSFYEPGRVFYINAIVTI